MDTLETRERGYRSQLRIIKAIFEAHPGIKPPWFHALVLAGADLDARGVDAIAFIKYEGEYVVRRVPIQIKSSWGGYEHYRSFHPNPSVRREVIVIVVDDTTDDATLRVSLFTQLAKIREENIRFDAFFSELLARPLPERAEARRQQLILDESRAQIRPWEHGVCGPHESPPPTGASAGPILSAFVEAFRRKEREEKTKARGG